MYARAGHCGHQRLMLALAGFCGRLRQNGMVHWLLARTVFDGSPYSDSAVIDGTRCSDSAVIDDTRYSDSAMIDDKQATRQCGCQRQTELPVSAGINERPSNPQAQTINEQQMHHSVCPDRLSGERLR